MWEIVNVSFDSLGVKTSTENNIPTSLPLSGLFLWIQLSAALQPLPLIGYNSDILTQGVRRIKSENAMALAKITLQLGKKKIELTNEEFQELKKDMRELDKIHSDYWRNYRPAMDWSNPALESVVTYDN